LRGNEADDNGRPNGNLNALIPSTHEEMDSEMIDSLGDYDFTTDWFSRSAEVWKTLLAELKPARILEVGSYEGRSTCFIIENCARSIECEIYCIDTWEGGFEHDKSLMSDVERRFDFNIAIAVQRTANAVLVNKIKKPSFDALSELFVQNEPPFDLIYLDGSHRASDVLSDAILAFKLLRLGGILIFDDYLWQFEASGQQNPLNMPKPAIDAFVNIFQRELEVIQDMPIWQIYLRKRSA
jgi:predicted O-methyltransferase YrrM